MPGHMEGGQWGAAGRARRPVLPLTREPTGMQDCNPHSQDPSALLTRQQQNVLTGSIFLRKQRLLRNKF